MGINIGLDIGAISLKLAALGKPADRAALESLCAAHPEFRLISLDERPLLLSDYRRISGSPIQSTYDLLRELYEIIPEDRVEGIRVTGSGSRIIVNRRGARSNPPTTYCGSCMKSSPRTGWKAYA